jgi:hypothetical protein
MPKFSVIGFILKPLLAPLILELNNMNNYFGTQNISALAVLKLLV